MNAGACGMQDLGLEALVFGGISLIRFDIGEMRDRYGSHADDFGRLWAGCHDGFDHCAVLDGDHPSHGLMGGEHQGHRGAGAALDVNNDDALF